MASVLRLCRKQPLIQSSSMTSTLTFWSFFFKGLYRGFAYDLLRLIEVVGIYILCDRFDAPPIGEAALIVAEQLLTGPNPAQTTEICEGIRMLMASSVTKTDKFRVLLLEALMRFPQEVDAPCIQEFLRDDHDLAVEVASSYARALAPRNRREHQWEPRSRKEAKPELN